MLEAKTIDYYRELNQCWHEGWSENLDAIFLVLESAKQKGTPVYILGNGGSASTASHMAVDLNKGAGLNAHSLTDNVGLITAWANDSNFNHVFVEQLKRNLTDQDTVIALSVSGDSPNIGRALRYANFVGAYTIGFFGMGGGLCRDLVNRDITVTSRNYGVVEDFHLSLNHLLAQSLTEGL
jgi:D-sedoheptulose 7-phosphate isomerase